MIFNKNITIGKLKISITQNESKDYNILVGISEKYKVKKIPIRYFEPEIFELLYEEFKMQHENGYPLSTPTEIAQALTTGFSFHFQTSEEKEKLFKSIRDKITQMLKKIK